MPDEVTDEELDAAYQQLAPRDFKQTLLLCINIADKRVDSLRDVFYKNQFRLFSALDDSHPGTCGLCPLSSRLNNSCTPNSKYSGSPNVNTMVATKDIAIGDEITFCYVPSHEYLTSSQRAKALWWFKCSCKACLIGTPFQQLSDMRRTLIRGLHYLIYGYDFNGKKHTAQQSIICDPRAKQAAEDQDVTLSKAFVNFLLMMTLLEEEEILSSVMVKQYGRIPSVIAETFQSTNNVQVASLAMKKDTWREKLCAAFQIYGCKDLADNTIYFDIDKP